MKTELLQQKIEKLEEIRKNLNRLSEYLHANLENGKDEGFEEVFDVKLSRIKQLESSLSDLDRQIEEDTETYKIWPDNTELIKFL